MKKIPAEQLVREKPSADCANCGKEVDSQINPQGTWVKQGNHYYCPRCAKEEGLY